MSYLSTYAKPAALLVAAAAFLSNVLTAQAADIPQPPALAVKSYQLYDYNSERVIAEQDGGSRVEPASLTKIMTAYLSFKALKNGHLTLTQTLPVSVKAWKVEGSKMFIEPNKPVTVDELLHGMIIQSGNDASITLAEGIAGSEEGFAELMNKEATRLGMRDTHYVNATGLPDPQHYTTAHDLAVLAGALIRDFPDQYKRLYSMKEYTYNKISQPNRNRLLWLDPYVDGMKTGHTKSAGYCLVTSAKRGDTRLISVVLGAPSDSARATESQKLLNYGFQFYESKLVYKRGSAVSTLKVWKGAENTVVATVAKDVSLTLPKGEYARVKAKVVSQQPLVAPVSAGQQVGTIQFILDEKVIAEHKLVASKGVEVAGIFGRILDSIKLWFE
ncbi:D-alanyl-D-alanine carboxypeptidase [Methylobacillus arboreus]|uniref:D-alanyl-D-alanine carboxypeptidase family protein n=1 Tax=Methylobacillus arboreus TaxID=755170 RepID=UPI001E369AED|nr:D-alanyl-D-alanine carboxypeptidase family protein [Methylobacillus arboreus]MCB5190711.1 D-alanyl-D-alanine carboxypeptidase [Methylobacillus arboreus]